MVQYHGTMWIFTKNAKNLFFRCSNWENQKKSFFIFLDKEKNYFWISLTSYGALTPVIKIHRHNCGVISYLCTRTVLDLVVSSQVSFRSCQIFFTSGRKRKKTSFPFSSSKKPKRRTPGGTHRFSVEQDIWLWATVGTYRVLLQPRRMVEGTLGH